MANAGTSKDPVGEVLFVAIKGVGHGVQLAFRGLRRLTAPAPIVGALVSAAVCAGCVILQKEILSCEAIAGVALPIPVRYLVYWFFLLIPLWYLMILGKVGKKKISKYDVLFLDIGFGKAGQLPALLAERMDGKKTIYVFKAQEPLSEWNRIKDRLEIGLACSIRAIQEGGSKGVVEIIAVPSSYKIPTMLPWTDDYISPDDGVICIGESDLDPVSFDLNRTPHVLAAGETGSGKSVVLRTILWQLICKGSRVYMIDFKGGVEFGKEYEKFGEVVTERTRALEILNMLVQENAARLQLFRELGVKNLKEYNNRTGNNLCRIGVVIDEIGEMMDSKGADKETKELMAKLEGAIATLARLSRATGINLLLGVQRPDANVLPGQIKNNVPVRICGRFADKAASEIVLGNTSAVGLPDIKGRFLYRVGNETIQFQSYYFDDEKNLKDIAVEQGEMLIDRRGHSPKKQERDPWEEPEEEEEAPAPRKVAAKKSGRKTSAPKSSTLDFDFDRDPWEDSE